jgi:uncharacterized protein DUF3883
VAYWWVSQNKTVDEEHSGGYLWAPVANALGQTPHHWQNMTGVQRGDVIFSYVEQAIISVAVAEDKAYRSPRPFRSSAAELWEKDGWRIDVAYDPVDPPMPIAPLADRLSTLLPERYSPLTKDGKGVQGYMFALPPEVGAFLLSELGREHPDFATQPGSRHARPSIITDMSAVLRPRRRTATTREGGGTTPAFLRRSAQAKRVGDRAESVVHQWLEANLPEPLRASLQWPARDGQQPGWDIQYVEDRRQIAVEVKGTTAAVFSNIEVTANEWQAAREKGRDYWLYLVTHCMQAEPRILRLQDPYRLHEAGTLDAAPLVWRLELRG